MELGNGRDHDSLHHKGLPTGPTACMGLHTTNLLALLACLLDHAQTFHGVK